MESTAALRFVKTLHKAGALAVANDVAEWQAQFFGRITEVEISLGSTGSTSGSTSVDVKKNGVSILTAVLTIAQGSATHNLRTGGANPGVIAAPAGAGEPGGMEFVPGDVIRVDVTAIPGTTSADLTVDLACIAKNT
jgi:hypothetical protein